jgi:hypothetical protein
VFGTQSVAYISSSQLNIGTNLITVNTDTPSVRFGGLAVYDSGSTGLTGSLLWDSQNNHWIYSNPSGSSYSGGMFISGPRTSTLGSETGTTSCALMMGQGGDHITSSAIFHYGNATCIPNILIGSTICTTMANASCIGIGTTTPLTILDIAGNNNNATCRNTLRFTDTDTGTQADQQIGKIEFYSSDTSSPGAGVKAYMGAFASDGTPDAYLSFATQDGSATPDPVERLRISSEGIACFSCQVCVPNIISTGASGGRYGTFNAPTNGGYITFEAGGTPFGDLGSYCAQYGTGDATTLLLGSRTGYALALGTNSTERLRITCAGNVLIGKTTNAGGKLQVSNGTLTFNVDHNADGPYLTGATDNNVSYRTLSYDASEHIFLISATAKMRITSGGVVSINQTCGYSVFNLTGTDCGWGEGMVINPAPNGYSAIHFRLEGRTGSCVTCTWQLGKETSASGYGELISLNKQGLTGGKSYRADASQQWKTNGDSIFGFNVGIGTCGPNARLTVWTPSTTGMQTALRLNNPFGFANVNTGAKIVFSQDRSCSEDIPIGEIGVGQEIGGTSSYGYIAFSTLNTTMSEKVRISSAGYVGIGTCTPEYPIHIYRCANIGMKIQTCGSTFASPSLNLLNGGVDTVLSATNTGLEIGTWSSNDILFRTGTVERMRITSDGNQINYCNIFLNQTSVATVNANATSIGINGIYYMNRGSGSGLSHVILGNGGNVIGSISSNTTNAQFNTSSDYRLKKDLKDFNALDVLLNMKLYDFAWKLNDSRMYGVMAHELKEILPYAVIGEKDELDENNNIKSQGVDYSLLTPILAKAIQEQQCTINTLKTCLGIA